MSIRKIGEVCKLRNRKKLQKEVIYITPAPVLAGLEGADQGVVRGMKMRGRVFILRVIAATDMTADKAEPQMYPAVAHFQTLFTTLRCPGLDIRFDLIEVGAGCHRMFIA